MLENIMLLLDTDFKQSTPLVDIAKGKYKLPETSKDLLNAIKIINREWKSSH
jgi:hypothetical protein